MLLPWCQPTMTWYIIVLQLLCLRFLYAYTFKHHLLPGKVYNTLRILISLELTLLQWSIQYMRLNLVFCCNDYHPQSCFKRKGNSCIHTVLIALTTSPTLHREVLQTWFYVKYTAKGWTCIITFVCNVHDTYWCCREIYHLRGCK